MISFYIGVFSGFGFGLLGVWFLFGCSWEDVVVIGFIGLFFNLLLLGFVIIECVYGLDVLMVNYVILLIYVFIGYLIGIIVMEIVKNCYNIC